MYCNKDHTLVLDAFMNSVLFYIPRIYLFEAIFYLCLVDTYNG